jgi:hypothetical protein
MPSLRSRLRAAGFALAVLGLVSMRPAVARADGSDERPAATERVVKIGPQAVVIVDAQGGARMYDDPSQQSRACKSARDCVGKALGLLGFFFAATYEGVTSGVEGSGRVLERVPTSE